MRLLRTQIQQLLTRMLDDEVEEVEIREGEDGRLMFYTPVVTLKQFPLNKSKVKVRANNE